MRECIQEVDPRVEALCSWCPNRPCWNQADPSVIEQVQALFLGDAPKSKAHLIRVLGHVLASASLEEFVTKGSAANNGLRSLVQRLASSNEKMKENAASVLADLFSLRKDLCGGLAFDENDNPCTKLLSGNTHAVATQLAHALGSLSNPTKKKIAPRKLSGAEVEVIKPLIKSAKTNLIESTENPMSTLANLLSDPNVAAEALNDDVVSALTRVLREEKEEQSTKGLLHFVIALMEVKKLFEMSGWIKKYCFFILLLFFPYSFVIALSLLVP